jgi:hypothetical protein
MGPQDVDRYGGAPNNTTGTQTAQAESPRRLVDLNRWIDRASARLFAISAY